MYESSYTVILLITALVLQDGQTLLLHGAAKSGDAPEVQRLIESYINSKTEVHSCMSTCGLWLVIPFFFTSVQYGKTALHLASEYGHVGAVEVLMGYHADINLQNEVLSAVHS